MAQASALVGAFSTEGFEHQVGETRQGMESSCGQIASSDLIFTLS